MTKSSIHPEDADPITPGDILDDLRTVVRDAESLLRATEGQVGERVAEVRSRIEEKLEDAREQLHEAGAGRAKHAKAAAHSTEKYIRENPWTALLIAAGVGYLIGTAGRRR